MSSEKSMRSPSPKSSLIEGLMRAYERRWDRYLNDFQGWASNILKALGITIFYVSACGLAAAVFFIVMHSGHTTMFSALEPRLAFQSNPDTRGTLNIVWMCLSTIFACVYVSFHPDVDDRDGPINYVRAGFLPEYPLNMAARQFRRAWQGVEEMQKISGGRWTLTHAFFASMGGFELEGFSGHSMTEDDVYNWLKTHAQSGTFDYDQLGHDIVDRSKKDFVAKSLTCLQSIRVLVQTVARFEQSLTVTQLELMTCGYILCTLAAYLFWLHKPYKVQRRIRLRQYAYAHRLDYKERRRRLCQTIIEPISRFAGRILSSFRGIDTETKYMSGIPSVVYGVIFGCIHCIAWKSTYTNSNGQTLWRICCVMLVACPALFSIAVCIESRQEINKQKKSNQESDSWLLHMLHPGLLLAFIYVIARIIVMLLIALSFFSLPADAYVEVKWMSFLPLLN